MDFIYDIAIIGLDPAGVTFARLLSKKFKIIAIGKKSSIENSFRKPCDGLLAHDARKIWIKSIRVKVKLILKRIKLLFMYNPFLRKLVMKSGLNSIDVIDA